MGRRRSIWLILLVVVAAATGFFLLRPEPLPRSAELADAPIRTPTVPIGASPVPSEPLDLAPIIALSPDCDLGEPLSTIFGRMVVFDPVTSQASPGAPIAVPGAPAPLAPTFERNVEPLDHGASRHVVARIALEGRWHGLRVTGLQLDFYEQSDVAGRQIRFADPAEQVRETLVAAGFSLPPVGAFEEVAGEGMMPSIGVESLEGGAALTCTTG